MNKRALAESELSLKTNRHGAEVPEGDLWMHYILTVADLANEGLGQSTDVIPALVILNRGDARSMRQLSSIAMLSPYVHPVLVIINHTGCGPIILQHYTFFINYLIIFPDFLNLNFAQYRNKAIYICRYNRVDITVLTHVT